jgi:hypothetical protein
MEQIETMTKPNCTERRCKGIVYREKRTAEDLVNQEQESKRIPAKIYCYSPIERTIARFLLRRDFVENLRDTSKDSARQILSDNDEMTDMYDGERWKELEIGLKRIIGDNGAVCDVETSPGSRKKLVSCDVGLNLTVNMDW